MFQSTVGADPCVRLNAFVDTPFRMLSRVCQNSKVAIKLFTVGADSIRPYSIMIAKFIYDTPPTG